MSVLNLTRIALLLACSGLYACSDSKDNNNTPLFPPEPGEIPRPTLELTYSESPIALDGINAEYAADVAYGDGERNVFDIDMLELMDSGDAPIYVHNYETSPDDLLNLFLHHGLHAIAVYDRAGPPSLAVG